MDFYINDSKVYLREYTLFRRDRNRSGGGVACYISDTLSSKVISCGTTNAGLEFLLVGFDGTLLPSELLVGCFFHPPSSSVQSVHDISSTFDNILISIKYFIACCDFNVDFSDSSNQLSKILHDLVYSHLVSQPIYHPTHVSESTSSIFDLFLISPDVPYTQATVQDHAITDHYPISLLTSWSSPKPSPKTISCRSFKNFDASKFLADLDHIPWQLMDTFDDIDDKVKVFETLFWCHRSTCPS